MSARAPLSERFWSKVDRTRDCWNWTASVNRHGYGQISLNRKPTHAHRVSYGLTHGPIPEGAYVLHRCDNRRCVRPEHLFLGTHADNMADMKQKGRGGGLSRPGQLNPQAKLTNREAEEVRRLCASGTSQRSVAKRFGVSQKAVWNIVNREGYVA